MKETQRSRILQYAIEKYGTAPDFPWQGMPEYAVLRHDASGKWYGVIMRVKRRMIGMNSDDELDILNVKCDPLLIMSLTSSPGYCPAYHMNKHSWISVLLDDTLADSVIEPLLDMSFDMTLKMKKAPKND